MASMATPKFDAVILCRLIIDQYGFSLWLWRQSVGTWGQNGFHNHINYYTKSHIDIRKSVHRL